MIVPVVVRRTRRSASRTQVRISVPSRISALAWRVTRSTEVRAVELSVVLGAQRAGGQTQRTEHPVTIASPTIDADPSLGVEHRPRGGQLHQESNEEHERGGEHDAHECHPDIQPASGAFMFRGRIRVLHGELGTGVIEFYGRHSVFSVLESRGRIVVSLDRLLLQQGPCSIFGKYRMQVKRVLVMIYKFVTYREARVLNGFNDCDELGSIRWSHLVNEAKSNNYVSNVRLKQ